MHARQRWMGAALLVGALTLFGCTEPPKALPKRTGPAKTEAIGDTKLKKITLTDQAVERLGLEMQPVQDVLGTKVIPYAAVVYDASGKTWVYTSPTELTFQRSEIVVSSIAGDKAFLTSGPDAGTEVVTVGTAELYGTETGLGY